MIIPININIFNRTEKKVKILDLLFFTKKLEINCMDKILIKERIIP